MSTEFYCEEFPTEQNGKPVQTLKDLLEACPEDRFHFMTPFGYVDLNAQDAEQLRQGAAMPAHAGESGWEIPIPAEKLLQQELVSVRKAENGQWYDCATKMAYDYSKVGDKNVQIRNLDTDEVFTYYQADVGALPDAIIDIWGEDNIRELAGTPDGAPTDNANNVRYYHERFSDQTAPAR